MTESPGQTVGPWTLHATLGRGGNATVWKAARPESETPVALKLINTTKVEREPYQRFVREIGFLREHQAVPGVLPLLDAHLPEQPTKADPPWLAMPVAVPISKALDGKSLADVVVSDARLRVRTKLEKAISEQDTQEQRRDLAHAAIRRLQELTAPLNEGLKSLHPRTHVDSASDELTRNLLRTHYGKEVAFRWFRCTIVAPFDDFPGSTALKMGRSLELFNDGDLQLRLMVHVGPQGVMGTDFDWVLDKRSAPVGSVEAEKMLDDGVHELRDALKRGVEVFVDNLPDPQ